MKIKDNTYIISGGVSGLGAAVCDMILENGGNAIIIDINEIKGNNSNKKATYYIGDVADYSSIENIINSIYSDFNQIAGLINCAGIGPAKRVVGRAGAGPIDFFQKVIHVNLIGTYNLIRLVAAHMQNNRSDMDEERGVIINTASIAAFDGQIGQAAYAASKGGIVSMTLPLAREFARMGIRVMTIAPGIFETPLMENFSPEVKQSLIDQTIFPKRLGQPLEYASLVKEIIQNTMLNGEVIRLDGSIRMNSK